MIRINVKLIILKTTRSGNLRFTLNIHEFEQLPRGGFAQFTVMLEDNQFADDKVQWIAQIEKDIVYKLW